MTSVGINAYTVGDTARVMVTVDTAATGLPIDPSAIECKIKLPDGTVADISGSIVHDGVGTYHADYPIVMVGTHLYEWIGTGAAPAAAVGLFLVNQNQF